MARYLLTVLLLFLPITSMAIPDDMEMVGEGKAKYLGMITVYDAALYIRGKSVPADILSPEISRCLKLDYAVEVSAEDIVKAANTILYRQHDKDRLRRLEAEIDELHGSYGKVVKGDNYTLCYDAAVKSTTLYRNRVPQVEIVSEEFAEIYFGIWLGPKEPLSDKLRNSLLGRR